MSSQRPDTSRCSPSRRGAKTEPARHYFTLTPGESSVGTIGEAPVVTTSEAAEAYQAAVEAFEAEDLPTAETKLEEALEHDPELRQGWEALSVIELEQGHYQEAVDAAEKAIELGSTDLAIFRTRWEAYRLLGDEAKTLEAQADLEQSGQLAEEAKRIYNEGIAAIKAGDKESRVRQVRTGPRSPIRTSNPPSSPTRPQASRSANQKPPRPPPRRS